MATPRPSLARRALFLAGVGIAVLAATEGAVRLGRWHHHRRTLHALATLDAARPPAGSTVRMRDLVAPSRHRDIVYELVPGLDVMFKGARVTTNAAGLRGAPHAVARTPGRRRLVGIGDSLMFGWGVADEETYLARLEHARPSWEAVNTAVPGYNAKMEVATLRARGLAYAPDLVLVGWCENDDRLPGLIPAHEDLLSPTRSFLLERIFPSLRPEPPAGSTARGLRTVPSTPDPADAPADYRHLVGWTAWLEAMDELVALSAEHGFELAAIVLWDPPGTERALAAWAERDIPVIDAAARIRAYMRAHGIEQVVGSELTVSEDDAHPSALGHRIAAEALVEWLDARDADATG